MFKIGQEYRIQTTKNVVVGVVKNRTPHAILLDGGVVVGVAQIVVAYPVEDDEGPSVHVF